MEIVKSGWFLFAVAFIWWGLWSGTFQSWAASIEARLWPDPDSREWQLTDDGLSWLETFRANNPVKWPGEAEEKS